jgi:hypothetical protein
MNKQIAQTLINNLLGRLGKVSNYFELPGGILSNDEVAALRLLSEAVETPDAVNANVISGNPDTSGLLGLSLEALTRTGPDENTLRVCIDFGTAMSKAWATGREMNETTPLVIGNYAGMPDKLAVPSSIFISDSGRIFLGNEAVLQHQNDSRRGRNRFDNIKHLLTHHAGGRLDDLPPLGSDIDPTASGLTQGDLLLLYLAWLTDISEKALQQSLERADRPLSDEQAYRAIVRRYAIPCFEDDRAERVRHFMEKTLLKAQILADSLSGSWDEITTARLHPLMKKLREQDVSPLKGKLLARKPEIREPIAAGASLVDQQFGEVNGRRYVLVVDSGAGTTDFAMFLVAPSRGDDEGEMRYSLLSKSVRMSTIAGNEADKILRHLILDACDHDSHKYNDMEKNYIRTDVESRLRDFKLVLFRNKKVDVQLTQNATGTVELDSLLSHQDMLRHGDDLKTMRDDIVRAVFEGSNLEEVYRHAPLEIHVLLTGGNAALPIVEHLSTGILAFEDGKVVFKKIDSLPQWVNRLSREDAELIANNFPQCAVAIGGSASELPEEMRDLIDPVVPAPPGPRVLSGYRK